MHSAPVPNRPKPALSEASQGVLFARLLRRARGDESRLGFSKRIGFSYTFVRAMEAGTRFPSDEVLQDIAMRLHINADELLLAAHCDRSPALTRALKRLGVYVSGLSGSHSEQGSEGLDDVS